MGRRNEGDLAIARGFSPVEYEQLISAVREAVHRVVPPNATVLVVSRGDEELVSLGPRRALHFPQDQDGRYAGYHPADSESAIAMVEQLHGQGAEYLVLPASSFWWLEHYDAFREHLEARYQVVESNENCWIVRLSEGTSVDADTIFMAEAPPNIDSPAPALELIDALLPSNARIAFLATQGQDRWDLREYEVWRLSQGQSDDESEVMKRLSVLEESGVEFIVVPSSAFEWVEEHPRLSERLRTQHRFITRQAHLCEIYEIRPPAMEWDQHGSEEATASRRSIGDVLRRILIPTRRNGRKP